MWSGFQGFRQRPKWSLWPVGPMANSAMLRWPISIAPAASNRASTVAVWSGTKSRADFRAASANLAGAVEHVLVRKRNAMQRTERVPRLDGPSACAGLLARRVRGHADEAIELRLQPFDAVETGFDQGLGAELALRDGGRRRAQRERRGIVHAPAPRRRPLEQAVIGFDGVVEDGGRRRDARGGVNPLTRAGDRSRACASSWLTRRRYSAMSSASAARRVVCHPPSAHSTISAAKDCTQICPRSTFDGRYR